MSTAKETGGEETPWGEVTPEAARRLLVAAVDAFAERGYHATTTRDIAGRAGMSPAALYIHYKTKEELLHRISRIGHDRALLLLQTEADSGGTAAERLAGAVRSFVRWHAERHTTARVVQYELDALGEEHRAEILALRRKTDAVVRRIISDGCARGVRRPRRPGHHTRSAVPVHRCGALVQRAGSRTPEEVGALYADLVLRMVAAQK
ncbi:TetR/AcrR family transcriptional regulator [Streptomyces sp. M10(2022)]